MTRTLEIVLILFLSLFSFFLGVKYSRAVKEHASWIFESSGDEVELPDLSNTENPEIDLPVDENGKSVDQSTPPAEDQNIVPSIDEDNSQVISNDNSSQPQAEQQAAQQPEQKSEAEQPAKKKVRHKRQPAH